MKFYSEKLSRFFDTADECEAAEEEVLEKERAKKEAEGNLVNELAAQKHVVDELRARYNELGKQYNEEYEKLSKMLSAFSRKYGYVPKGFNGLDLFFSLL